MKRLVCTVCSVLLCVGLLSGCGTSLEGEESVVYVGKKGVIESLDVESLDQSYYDETELKSYVDAEVKSAIGRADVVVKMQDAIYVFEFKVDGTPEEALEQINSQGYIIPYQPDHRKVVKVGVNFDSATRSIGDWKIVEEV